MSLILRPEKPDDADSIRRIHELAFGQPDEARLVEALARDGDVVLSLVAADAGDKAIGHLLFTRISAPAELGLVVALAPLAVLPDYHRQGAGSALVQAAHEQLQSQGVSLSVVLGDPAYYTRFGYSVELAQKLKCPYSGPHLMALELKPGVLDNVDSLEIAYAPAFSAL